MNKVILIIIFFFPAFPVISQINNNLIRGKITEQNSDNQAIAEVQIKADFANATVSDVGGEFTLTFNKIPPGGETVLSISYKDWVVVNEKDLITKLPDNPKKQILKFHMCPEHLLAQNRMKYYEISEQQILEKYTLKLAELNRERDDFAALAKQLADERDRLLDGAYELANKFSRYNFDDRSEIQEQAFAEFQKGNIEKALQILESVNSKQIIAKAKLEKEKWTAMKDTAEVSIANADSTINQEIQKLIFQAELYTLSFQFDSAAVAYETAVNTDSTNFDIVVNFAYYLAKQNRHDQAIRWYESALKLTNSEYQNSSLQNNLAILYQDKNDYTAAEIAFKRALEIRDRLASNNPQTYEPDVAQTLNNLGNLYSNKNDYSKAKATYKRALKIRERLAVNNPQVYEPYVALTLNNLGNLYGQKNDYTAAEAAYKRALKIRERLAVNNPQVYEPFVAQTLNNLGVLYLKKNDYPTAEVTFKRALEIHERLTSNNPQTYEPDVAQTLNNLGNLYSNKKDYPTAEAIYKRALKIRERLAVNNPQAYEPFVALTLNNLGVLYRQKNNFDAAEAAYKRTLEIYERLALNNPEVYDPDVALTLNNLGVLYLKKNDYPAAEAAFKRALEIHERLPANNLKVYESDEARILNNLGNLYLDKNDYPAAETAYKKALVMHERLAENNPQSYEPFVALTLNNLGVLYRQKNSFDAAEAAFKRALEINERLAANNPQAYEPDVAMTLNYLGNLYGAINDYNSVVEVSKKTLIIRQRIFTEFLNENTSLDLAHAYGNLSWYLLFIKRFVDAEEAALAGLNISGFDKPAGFDKQTERIYSNLAAALLFQGKYEKAEKIYKQFIDKPYNEEKLWNEVFIFDLDELEKAGITHPDVKKIKELLTN